MNPKLSPETLTPLLLLLLIFARSRLVAGLVPGRHCDVKRDAERNRFHDDGLSRYNVSQRLHGDPKRPQTLGTLNPTVSGHFRVSGFRVDQNSPEAL